MGGQIAVTAESIIDPDNLKIIAFRIDSPLIKSEGAGDILQTQKIREISDLGMVVDSVDDFTVREDVVKLDEIMSLNFQLIGMKVETKKGTRLGKVVGYTVETTEYNIMQIIVQRPVMKALIDPELTIGRKEVVEVTDYKIIVKDEEDKIRARGTKEDFVPNFVNPFRKTQLATNDIRQNFQPQS